jgi:hypothetical protein
MMKKKLVAGLTSVGLIAGTGVATAVVGAPGLAVAQEDGEEAPQVPGPQHRLGRVFADLVESGVLEEDEVTAVHEVLKELRDAARADNEGETPRPGRRHPVRAGFALHELLEDGVIDADELAALPDDHPVFDEDGPFAPYLADGELTTEELEEIKAARQAEAEARRAERSAAIEEALQSLVDDGTLTADQLDAVIEAIETSRAERPYPIRRGMRAGWQIAELLEDGVIDATELAELPEGHPLADPDGPAAEYLDDGQLTEEELAELRSELRSRWSSAAGQNA